MLKIRLARIGKRKKPTYRIIITESARDNYGKFLEILGHYNPFSKVCEVKKDRVLYWISQGAKVTPTLHNLLIDQNVLTGSKVKAYRPKKIEKTEEQSKPQAQPKAEAAVETKAEKREVVSEAKAEEKPVEEKSEPAKETEQK